MSETHSSTPEVSIVIPVCNEEDTVQEAVERSISTLDRFLSSSEYEVIIVENGSTDDTLAVANEITTEYRSVRVVVKEDTGRGGALNKACRAAVGDTIAYFDADLSTDMQHLEELIEAVRTEGYDIATGSRYLPGSVVSRPLKRRIPSKGFNFLTRTFLGSSLADHQCGFKSFKRDVILDLIPSIQDDHWFWDTEVLVRSRRRGYRVKEFPVEWEPKADSEVELVEDILGMGQRVVDRWWEFSVAPRITRRRTMGAATLLLLLAVVLSPYYVDIDLLVTRLTSVSLPFVGLAMVVYLLSLPVRGIRYSRILNMMRERVDIPLSTGAICISQTANFVVPARAGDAVRAYIVKSRQNVDYPTGFASLFVERVFDLTTIVGLATVGTGLLLLLGDNLYDRIVGAVLSGPSAARVSLTVATGVAVVTAITIVTVVYTSRNNKTYLTALQTCIDGYPYLEQITEHFQQFGSDVQRIVDKPRIIGAVLVFGLLVWLLDIATALVVFHAFDVPITMHLAVVAIVAVSVGNLSKVLPLTSLS